MDELHSRLTESLVALERLLDAGAVIKSELKGGEFTVRVHMPDLPPFFAKDTELAGAVLDVYNQYRRDTQDAA